MSAYFGEKGMGGMSKWMRLQYQEELTHAEKIMDYIIQTADMLNSGSWKKYRHHETVLSKFLKTRYVMKKLLPKWFENLMNLAIEEKDHATKNMLAWYVLMNRWRRIELHAVVDALKINTRKRSGLYMLDRELGSRKD